MKNYDEEFTKCLEKSKMINSKIHKRSDNLSRNIPDTSDNIIKESISELFLNIQVLKSLSKSDDLSYQEYTRRTTNNKKIEEQYKSLKRKFEENVNKTNIRII